MGKFETLLGVRNEAKKGKPDFIRQDIDRRKRISFKWRKPKGIHSKIRHQFKGRRRMPSPGYGSPSEVKGLHSSGLNMVNVATLILVNDVDKEHDGIIISKKVGLKKKLAILKKAKEMNIHVLNLNVDEQIKKIETFIASKRKSEKGAKKEENAAQMENSTEKQKLAEEQKKETNASRIVAGERDLADKRTPHVVGTPSQLNEKKTKDKVLTKRI